jgi:hypothetical protein
VKETLASFLDGAQNNVRSRTFPTSELPSRLSILHDLLLKWAKARSDVEAVRASLRAKAYAQRLVRQGVSADQILEAFWGLELRRNSDGDDDLDLISNLV